MKGLMPVITTIIKINNELPILLSEAKDTSQNNDTYIQVCYICLLLKLHNRAIQIKNYTIMHATINRDGISTILTHLRNYINDSVKTPYNF